MTDRDSTTRTRARTPGEEDYPPSTAVHWRVTDPTQSGIVVDTNAMREGRKQTNTWAAYAGSRLKLSDALGRRRPKCHPSSRTGENPPYGMIGGIEETSASFEARSAPRSYPTLKRPFPHSPEAPAGPGGTVPAIMPEGATGQRAPAQPAGGGTQAGRVLLSCPSWTPRTQIVRCPRNRGNFRYGAFSAFVRSQTIVG